MDELLSLVVVLHSESVKVLGTSDLELGHSTILLDGGRLDVLSSGKLNEVLDVLNFDLSFQLALSDNKHYTQQFVLTGIVSILWCWE